MASEVKAQRSPDHPKRPGVSRGLVIAATVLAMIIAGAVVAAALLFDSFVRDRIVEEARKRGVVLVEIGDVDVWFGSATLRDVQFRLLGVESLVGQAQIIDVLLTDWKPSRVSADGVAISVVGSAADIAFEIGEWTKNHPEAYRVPGSAKNVDLAWRSDPASSPWLVLSGGSVLDTPGGARFDARQAVVSGVPIGSVSAAWTTNQATVGLGFGAADPQTAPVQVQIEHARAPPRAFITLKPTRLEKLSGPLGVELPVEGVTAQGSAELVFTQGLESGPITGLVDIALDGYVPPHPVELSGFIFGNRTTFTSNFEVSQDRMRVTFTDSRVRAGAFRLKGDGSMQRHPGYATLLMELRGNLRCSAVADSAARARLGTVLGKMLGDAAKRVVEGSVAVGVKILADTRDLEAARVERTIGIGCGLKPLDLDDLRELGVPEELIDIAKEMPKLPEKLPTTPEEVREHLPTLPSALPPIPSSLPPIPSAIPKLNLPTLPSAFPSFGTKPEAQQDKDPEAK